MGDTSKEVLTINQTANIAVKKLVVIYEHLTIKNNHNLVDKHVFSARMGVGDSTKTLPPYV